MFTTKSAYTHTCKKVCTVMGSKVTHVDTTHARPHLLQRLSWKRTACECERDGSVRSAMADQERGYRHARDSLKVLVLQSLVTARNTRPLNVECLYHNTIP